MLLAVDLYEDLVDEERVDEERVDEERVDEERVAVTWVFLLKSFAGYSAAFDAPGV